MLNRPWFCRWRIKRRFVVAILAFFGFVNVYMLRVNLSIAVVAMTSNKTRMLRNGTEVNVSFITLCFISSLQLKCSRLLILIGIQRLKD